MTTVSVIEVPSVGQRLSKRECRREGRQTDASNEVGKKAVEDTSLQRLKVNIQKDCQHGFFNLECSMILASFNTSQFHWRLFVERISLDSRSCVKSTEWIRMMVFWEATA